MTSASTSATGELGTSSLNPDIDTAGAGAGAGAGAVSTSSEKCGNVHRYLTKTELENVKNSKFDCIVIGSGVGGLTCAAYLAKAAGKRVLVLEKHSTIGGCTHTFINKPGSDRIEFDVGVHYVGGNVWKEDPPKSTNRTLFDYLTNEQLKWRKLDDVFDVAVINGEEYPLRSGKHKQIEDLVKWFPRETSQILEYWKKVEEASNSFGKYVMYQIASSYLPNFVSSLVEPFVLREFHHNSDYTIDQVLDQLEIRNPTLRALLCYDYGNYGLDPSKASWITHAAVAYHYVEGAAYPVGGSSSLAKYLIPTIEEAGGAVFALAGVDSLVVNPNSGSVEGVKLHKNNEIIHCGQVISAVGAWNTFNRLLSSYESPRVSEIRSLTNVLPESPAHIVLFAELEGTSEELKLPAANIWVEPSNELSRLARTYEETEGKSDFPAVFISFASAKDPETWQKKFPGKSVCEVVVTGDAEWFAKWGGEPSKHRSEEYQKIKDHLRDRMLRIVFERFPQLKNKVKFSEVGTPLSSIHNLNSHRGVSYGLGCTTARYRQTNWLRPDAGGSVPGLYLTGQDIVCNGIQGSLMSGISTASAVSFVAARKARTLLGIGSVPGLGTTGTDNNGGDGEGKGGAPNERPYDEGLDDLEFETE